VTPSGLNPSNNHHPNSQNPNAVNPPQKQLPNGQPIKEGQHVGENAQNQK
jgi:hypothetical protein